MDSCAKQLRSEYDLERTRLMTLCEKWEDILEKNKRNNKYNEDVKGTILAIIGQTKLLVNKKMKQFEGLLVEREQIEGDGRPITESDLRGFWEMVMIEVDIMATKFNEIEDLVKEEPDIWFCSDNHRKGLGLNINVISPLRCTKITEKALYKTLPDHPENQNFEMNFKTTLIILTKN